MDLAQISNLPSQGIKHTNNAGKIWWPHNILPGLFHFQKHDLIENSNSKIPQLSRIFQTQYKLSLDHNTVVAEQHILDASDLGVQINLCCFKCKLVLAQLFHFTEYMQTHEQVRKWVNKPVSKTQIHIVYLIYEHWLDKWTQNQVKWC